MPDVYATARGPLARLASPLSARARARRHARFFALTRAGGRALACSTSAAAASACARSSPTSTSPASTWPSAPAIPARSCAPTPPTGLPFAGRRVRPRVLLERDRARRRRSAALRSPLSSAASAAAGSCRRPRVLVSRSSRTRCCRRPTGCPRELRRRYWRLGAAGAWEEISLLAPRASSRSCSGRPAPSASARSSRAGCACARLLSRRDG